MGLVVAREKVQLIAGVNEHGWGRPHEISYSSGAQKRLDLARYYAISDSSRLGCAAD